MYATLKLMTSASFHIHLLYLLLGLPTLFSCTGDEETVEPEIEIQEPAYLDGEMLEGIPLARRISIDIRGEFLDWDEVQILESDPSQIERLMDEWLEEDAHKKQLINIFSSMLLTKVDEFNVTSADFYLEDDLEYDFVRSIGEESPRFMAHIATQDVPWSQVVQADYTIANSILTQIWNLEPVDRASTGTDDWVLSRYVDGRPPLGVVSTNGIWWRYYTTPNNKSRARAAFLTRLLVCDDILSRAVTSPSSLQVDAQNIDDFVQTEPSCLACHQTLDPLAASLYGFWQHDMHDVVELSIYHPEREWDGERDLQLEMGWYGKTLSAPAQLGESIASDERFYPCATTSLAERFWRRPIAEIDEGRIETIAHTVEQQGGRYSQLIRAIVDSPEYKLKSATAELDPRAESGAKMMTAHQLTHAVYKLTGFEWKDGTLDLLDNDEWGYRMLLGGIDGRSTTKWLGAPSATRQLTLKRLAQSAAEYVVQESIYQSGGILFDGQNPALVSSLDPEFRIIIGQWYWRLMGRDIEENEFTILQNGFADVEENFGRTEAWQTILSITLRNTQSWIY